MVRLGRLGKSQKIILLIGILLLAILILIAFLFMRGSTPVSPLSLPPGG